ncbi:MAG: methylmalonyl-CoA mutase, partial [Deinococcus sp.]|nr:methylmalonyl-CoA mutase [Deinococcus sp.]
AVSSLEDMETLFNGINLEQVTTSMTINSPAPVLWAFYLAMAQRLGYDWRKISGTIQNDILKEYIAQKEYIFPPRPSLRLVIDTFEYGTTAVPRWNTISISGYHIREAGSTAVQELAFTLANGFTYVQAAVERGLDVDQFAPRLSFFFNVHNDFFEELCKFRAARRIWAQEMRQRFGAKDPRSWTLRTHAQTSGVSLPAQQPEVNIARVAIQALAAVLGGTQSLHTNAFDEALALPTEDAARIALRTQQVIAHETGVANLADPLGGSYYVEWLTKKMEGEAYRYFQRIDALGGVIPAIDVGFFAQEIGTSSYRYQQETDSGQRTIVGVNAFQLPEEPALPLLRIDVSAERSQVQRLTELRQRRDPGRWQQALVQLGHAARASENTMPALIECAHAQCTLGEIMAVLKVEFGEYREAVAF